MTNLKLLNQFGNTKVQTFNVKTMENPVLKFLLEKKRKGLPMNIGEAMSETNTWIEGCEVGSMGPLLNNFRKVWEKS